VSDTLKKPCHHSLPPAYQGLRKIEIQEQYREIVSRLQTSWKCHELNSLFMKEGNIPGPF